MLGLFWRASHGHAIPEDAWPAVEFARWWLGEPASWARALADMAEGLSAALEKQ